MPKKPPQIKLTTSRFFGHIYKMKMRLSVVLEDRYIGYKSRKKVVVSSILPKNRTKLTILSREDAQDSEFCLFLGELMRLSRFTDLYRPTRVGAGYLVT